MEKNISLFYTNIENKEGIEEFFSALEEYAEFRRTIRRRNYFG